MSDQQHVIFGTGPLGQSVMRELVLRGQPVRMVNQSGHRPDGVPPQVEVMGGDAFNLDFTCQAAANAAVVYQCAQPPYWEWTTKFIPMQESIMAGAAAAGAKLVSGDNLYMYGEVSGPMHEDLPNQAMTRKGRTRAEAANRLLAAHQSGQVRVAIGRGSDFFGPGVLNSSAGERMFQPAVKGQPAEGLGNIDLDHTYTYINDFGKALVILGEHDEALGQVWHVPSAPAVSTRRFIQYIAEGLGRPVKASRMGRLMLSMAGLFIPGAREMVEMMYQFEKPFVVDHSKFVRAFGDHATPLSESIGQTVKWFQQRG